MKLRFRPLMVPPAPSPSAARARVTLATPGAPPPATSPGLSAPPRAAGQLSGAAAAQKGPPVRAAASSRVVDGAGDSLDFPSGDLGAGEGAGGPGRAPALAEGAARAGRTRPVRPHPLFPGDPGCAPSSAGNTLGHAPSHQERSCPLSGHQEVGVGAQSELGPEFRNPETNGCTRLEFLTYLK